MAQLLVGGGTRPLRQVTFEWGEPLECDITREELEMRTRPLWVFARGAVLRGNFSHTTLAAHARATLRTARKAVRS